MDPLGDEFEGAPEPIPTPTPERLPVERVPATPAEATPDEFAAALIEQKQKRTMLEAYIRESLKDGVDYGVFPPSKKRTLLKPGAEKIAAVLRLRPTFAKDVESRDMLDGDGEGVVCYICTLVTADGVIVGEGRGACGPEPTHSGYVKPPNNRIKYAMKRAQVDAVLRVAALSEQFTQDLEDMPADPPSAPSPPPAPRPSPPPAPVPPPPPASHAPSAPTTPAPPPPAPPTSAAPRGLWTHKAKQEGAKQQVGKEGEKRWAEGVFRFEENEYPLVGSKERQRKFFAPSDHPKAAFTREEPWTTWERMTWGQLVDYAANHRVDHELNSEDTTRFNDPIKAIVYDSFWTCYRGKATWIAQMVVACDFLADNLAGERVHAAIATPAPVGPEAEEGEVEPPY